MPNPKPPDINQQPGDKPTLSSVGFTATNYPIKAKYKQPKRRRGPESDDDIEVFGDEAINDQEPDVLTDTVYTITNDRGETQKIEYTDEGGLEDVIRQAKNYPQEPSPIIMPEKVKYRCDDVCYTCHEGGGSLIKCTKCSLAFHGVCLDRFYTLGSINKKKYVCQTCRHAKNDPKAKKAPKKASGVSGEANFQTVAVEFLRRRIDDDDFANKLAVLAKTRNPQFFTPEDDVLDLTPTLPGMEANPPKQLVTSGPASCHFCHLKFSEEHPGMCCDFCDNKFHAHCLQPPSSNGKNEVWICPFHIEHAINAMTQTHILSRRLEEWNRGQLPLNVPEDIYLFTEKHIKDSYNAPPQEIVTESLVAGTSGTRLNTAPANVPAAQKRAQSGQAKRPSKRNLTDVLQKVNKEGTNVFTWQNMIKEMVEVNRAMKVFNPFEPVGYEANGDPIWPHPSDVVVGLDQAPSQGITPRIGHLRSFAHDVVWANHGFLTLPQYSRLLTVIAYHMQKCVDSPETNTGQLPGQAGDAAPSSEKVAQPTSLHTNASSSLSSREFHADGSQGKEMELFQQICNSEPYKPRASGIPGSGNQGGTHASQITTTGLSQTLPDKVVAPPSGTQTSASTAPIGSVMPASVSLLSGSSSTMRTNAPGQIVAPPDVGCRVTSPTKICNMPENQPLGNAQLSAMSVPQGVPSTPATGPVQLQVPTLQSMFGPPFSYLNIERFLNLPVTFTVSPETIYSTGVRFISTLNCAFLVQFTEADICNFIASLNPDMQLAFYFAVLNFLATISSYQPLQPIATQQLNTQDRISPEVQAVMNLLVSLSKLLPPALSAQQTPNQCPMPVPTMQPTHQSCPSSVPGMPDPRGQSVQNPMPPSFPLLPSQQQQMPAQISPLQYFQQNAEHPQQQTLVPSPTPRPQQQTLVRSTTPTQRPQQQTLVRSTTPTQRPQKQMCVPSPTSQQRPQQQIPVPSATPRPQQQTLVPSPTPRPQQQTLVRSTTPTQRPQQQRLVPSPTPRPQQQTLVRSTTPTQRPQKQMCVPSPTSQQRPQQQIPVPSATPRPQQQTLVPSPTPRPQQQTLVRSTTPTPRPQQQTLVRSTTPTQRPQKQMCVPSATSQQRHQQQTLVRSTTPTQRPQQQTLVPSPRRSQLQRAVHSLTSPQRPQQQIPVSSPRHPRVRTFVPSPTSQPLLQPQIVVPSPWRPDVRVFFPSPTPQRRQLQAPSPPPVLQRQPISRVQQSAETVMPQPQEQTVPNVPPALQSTGLEVINLCMSSKHPLMTFEMAHSFVQQLSTRQIEAFTLLYVFMRSRDNQQTAPTSSSTSGPSDSLPNPGPGVRSKNLTFLEAVEICQDMTVRHLTALMTVISWSSEQEPKIRDSAPLLEAAVSLEALNVARPIPTSPQTAAPPFTNAWKSIHPSQALTISLQDFSSSPNLTLTPDILCLLDSAARDDLMINAIVQGKQAQDTASPNSGSPGSRSNSREYSTEQSPVDAANLELPRDELRFSNLFAVYQSDEPQVLQIEAQNPPSGALRENESANDDALYQEAEDVEEEEESEDEVESEEEGSDSSKHSENGEEEFYEYEEVEDGVSAAQFSSEACQQQLAGPSSSSQQPSYYPLSSGLAPQHSAQDEVPPQAAEHQDVDAEELSQASFDYNIDDILNSPTDNAGQQAADVFDAPISPDKHTPNPVTSSETSEIDVESYQQDVVDFDAAEPLEAIPMESEDFVYPTCVISNPVLNLQPEETPEGQNKRHDMFLSVVQKVADPTSSVEGLQKITPVTEERLSNLASAFLQQSTPEQDEQESPMSPIPPENVASAHLRAKEPKCYGDRDHDKQKINLCQPHELMDGQICNLVYQCRPNQDFIARFYMRENVLFVEMQAYDEFERLHKSDERFICKHLTAKECIKLLMPRNSEIDLPDPFIRKYRQYSANIKLSKAEKKASRDNQATETSKCTDEQSIQPESQKNNDKADTSAQSSDGDDSIPAEIFERTVASLRFPEQLEISRHDVRTILTLEHFLPPRFWEEHTNEDGAVIETPEFRTLKRRGQVRFKAAVRQQAQIKAALEGVAYEPPPPRAPVVRRRKADSESDADSDVARKRAKKAKKESAASKKETAASKKETAASKKETAASAKKKSKETAKVKASKVNGPVASSSKASVIDNKHEQLLQPLMASLKAGQVVHDRFGFIKTSATKKKKKPELQNKTKVPRSSPVLAKSPNQQIKKCVAKPEKAELSGKEKLLKRTKKKLSAMNDLIRRPSLFVTNEEIANVKKAAKTTELSGRHQASISKLITAVRVRLLASPVDEVRYHVSRLVAKIESIFQIFDNQKWCGRTVLLQLIRFLKHDIAQLSTANEYVSSAAPTVRKSKFKKEKLSCKREDRIVKLKFPSDGLVSNDNALNRRNLDRFVFNEEYRSRILAKSNPSLLCGIEGLFSNYYSRLDDYQNLVRYVKPERRQREMIKFSTRHRREKLVEKLNIMFGRRNERDLLMSAWDRGKRGVTVYADTKKGYVKTKYPGKLVLVSRCITAADDSVEDLLSSGFELVDAKDDDVADLKKNDTVELECRKVGSAFYLIAPSFFQMKMGKELEKKTIHYPVARLNHKGQVLGFRISPVMLQLNEMHTKNKKCILPGEKTSVDYPSIVQTVKLFEKHRRLEDESWVVNANIASEPLKHLNFKENPYVWDKRYLLDNRSISGLMVLVAPFHSYNVIPLHTGCNVVGLHNKLIDLYPFIPKCQAVRQAHSNINITHDGSATLYTWNPVCIGNIVYGHPTRIKALKNCDCCQAIQAHKQVKSDNTIVQLYNEAVIRIGCAEFSIHIFDTNQKHSTSPVETLYPTVDDEPLVFPEEAVFSDDEEPDYPYDTDIED